MSYQVSANRILTSEINPSTTLSVTGNIAIASASQLTTNTISPATTTSVAINGVTIPDTGANALKVRKIAQLDTGIPIEIMHDATAPNITIANTLTTDSVTSRTGNLLLATPSVGGEVQLTADRVLKLDKTATHSGTLNHTGNIITSGYTNSESIYTDVIYPRTTNISFQGPVILPSGTHTVNGTLQVVNGIVANAISAFGSTVTIDDDLTLTATHMLTAPIVRTPVLENAGVDPIQVNNVLQLQAVVSDNTAEEILARNSSNQLVRIPRSSLSNIWTETFQYGSVVLSSLSSSAILRDIIFDRTWFFKRNNASLESDYVLVSNLDADKSTSSSITFRNSTTETPQIEMGALISPVVSFTFEISFKLSHTTGFWVDGLHRFYIGLGRNLYMASNPGDHGGIGIDYLRGTNGDRLRVITSTTPSAIASTVDSGVAVNTSWNNLKIVMVRGASYSASVFLNGSQIGTTQTIPLFKMGPRIYHEYTNLSGVSPGSANFGLRLSDCRITY